MTEIGAHMLAFILKNWKKIIRWFPDYEVNVYKTKHINFGKAFRIIQTLHSNHIFLQKYNEIRGAIREDTEGNSSKISWQAGWGLIHPHEKSEKTYFVVGTLECSCLLLFINSIIVGFYVLFVIYSAKCLRMATRTGRDMPHSLPEYHKRRIFVQNKGKVILFIFVPCNSLWL